ncbi:MULTISPECIES: primary-amine oxidase [unclassified Amycolatopsis]|uniref:primary-amine oxidase n=1 Tax=unclassified Amycolatopsis TaxID=2618356 RepID=UPI0021028876|nr:MULTISPECIES: primary-amine oxidase [unclassified Amycolatopsis]
MRQTAKNEETRMAHPLSRLTEDEVARNRALLAGAGIATESTRFALVSLLEPAKAAVLAWQPGDPVDRRVRSLLLDRRTGAVRETVVSLTSGEVVADREVDVVAEGQPPILHEEFDLVEEILWQDEAWNAAMRRRGIDEPRSVRISALSAGCFDIPGEIGLRLVRCLAFLQLNKDDNLWAHPIDGVVAYVDLIAGRVHDLVDDGPADIPRTAYDYHLDGPVRDTQKPIVITQPEGPSFTVDGDVVTWEKWQFRIGFNAVEGLTLHQIGFQDGDRLRPVVYRASVAEMVVPYGDPSPVRFWQNYFDAGEYSLGKEANSLTLGCDCLGEIRYFDAVLHDDDGHPHTIPNAICMHEEDAGVLWKHTDHYNGSVSTRRQRRLVISFFVTVGNYDYGFYWYLYLDGTIELECKATGIVFTSAFPADDDYPWATEIAPGIGAPFHQHLFSARLDMMVDGLTNAVDEIDAQRVPIGPGNLHGNAFTRKITRLAKESEAARLADGNLGRTWRISNPESCNALGKPVGYTLHPEGQPPLLADDASSIARRAAFTRKHLWVTAYAEDERFPAGEYVNQNDGNTGIDTWIQADRDLDGADLVVWHTFGLTHYPRTEDWPIMPVDHTGFTLKPSGFFDVNPALDTPAPKPQHPGCCH